MNNIRNFCIIAHIDHGKTTLADCLLRITGLVNDRNNEQRVLDSMDLEKERGITIKSHPVCMSYAHKAQKYILNMVDTPGHVDFSYEIGRSLSACEASLLLVDATQGIEAQTIANCCQAINSNHVIIPVINKIDLPAASIKDTQRQISEDLGISEDQSICISAKNSTNIDLLLDRIITICPPPCVRSNVPQNVVQGLIFDARYDSFMGIIIMVRIFSGHLKKGTRVLFVSTRETYSVDEIGVFTPGLSKRDFLGPGEIGFFTAFIRNLDAVYIGDTIVSPDYKDDTSLILPGFQKPKQFVFCVVFPIDQKDYDTLCNALKKLRLSDSSFTFANEHSLALGLGFRCGFLGVLHMEIITERISREFNIEIISTAPSLVYKVIDSNHNEEYISSPEDFSSTRSIKVLEPFSFLTILSPEQYFGALLDLLYAKRAQEVVHRFTSTHVTIECVIPTNEIIFDFHSRVKSISKGYASFDYNYLDYRESDLVRMDIYINRVIAPELSMIIHRSSARRIGQMICSRLKDEIPRHLFQIPLQAAINSKIIVRENIPPFRKDVTGKCYGGDVTRKRKLLEKQKKGKKRMRSIGSVNIPREAFVNALKEKDT